MSTVNSNNESVTGSTKLPYEAATHDMIMQESSSRTVTAGHRRHSLPEEFWTLVIPPNEMGIEDWDDQPFIQPQPQSRRKKNKVFQLGEDPKMCPNSWLKGGFRQPTSG
ncbi:hypothetical protein E2P81_ATG08301 [Venturia nashicola]|uniref:Uncharacterized protein n=1 Tax=Venturia nashicola TaxID=86259 RepID=A0A4Z1NVC6_9PEZI|nr:hypothetical protein E6O75_ATG08485 [Venturia nashicola]TLD21713.1 hypothetical protein E2P81_ATG08301 [Venturia nashicola]